MDLKDIALPFKDNASAFEYACKYLECDLRQGALLPALVMDARALHGTQESVATAPDGIQTAIVKLASHDGGFRTIARTTGRGPALSPGDFVAWFAGAYSAQVASAADDKRFGWIGCIVGTLKPEWKGGGWAGGVRFSDQTTG